MFSRTSFFRQTARDSDPLRDGKGEATEAEVVGALNRLELAADAPASSRASGSHARLRDMSSESAGGKASAGFPSTSFSRTRRATPSTRSVSIASASASAGDKATSEALETTPDATKDTRPDGADSAQLLPDGSLGRRLWQHVQASPEASDVRAMLCDSEGRALLLLPQTPFPAEDDLGALLDDHVLFTDQLIGANTVAKFATSSGVHGSVGGESVRALGVLPPMEQLMQAVGRTDAPRATLFDMLDGEAQEDEASVVLRIARWARLELPDGRRVHVAVTSGRLDRALVADWSVTGLSAHVQASLDRTLATLVPSAPAPSANPEVCVAIEKIMQMVHGATGDQQTAEAWQALASELLHDALAAMLDALESDSSACGDAEQRRQICGKLVQAVEAPVLDAVYLRVFAPPEDRLADQRFDARAEALRQGGLTPGHLGVGEKDAGASRDLVRACVKAAERLAEMDGVHAPADKLQRIVDAHRVLVAHVDNPAQGASLSADSILPLMIYSIVRMPPGARLVSNLRFVQRWHVRSLLAAHQDYCLTNMLAAVEYVVSGESAVHSKPDGSLSPRVPALRALHGLLVGNVGIDVVQGVADGGKKVAAGVYDATLGRLIDSAGQHIFRSPWRVLPMSALAAGDRAAAAGEQEMQDALRSPGDASSDSLQESASRAVVRLPRATLRNAPRPAVIERFMYMQPGDLTLNDVSQLLSSYKELASYIDK